MDVGEGGPCCAECNPAAGEAVVEGRGATAAEEAAAVVTVNVGGTPPANDTLELPLRECMRESAMDSDSESLPAVLSDSSTGASECLAELDSGTENVDAANTAPCACCAAAVVATMPSCPVAVPFGWALFGLVLESLEPFCASLVFAGVLFTPARRFPAEMSLCRIDFFFFGFGVSDGSSCC